MSFCNHLMASSLLALAALHATVPAWALDKKQPPCQKVSVTADGVKLLGGDQIAFASAAASSVTTVPLSLPSDVKASQIELTLVQVRRDKLVDDTLLRHFAVEKAVNGQPGETPMARVTINEVAQLLPASYSLLLRARYECTMTHVTFTLERLGATLAEPKKLNLDIRQKVGFGAPGSAAPVSVRLPAVSSSGPLTLRDITFRDVGWRDATPENINASLGATGTTDTTGVTVAFMPTGFPLGTSTGKLELNSPDLKAPVAVEVEVRASLYPFWIPLIVLMGIVTGVLTREQLPQFIALRQAQAKGTAATAEFRRQIAPIKDALFRDAVSEKIEALEALWSSSKRKFSPTSRTEEILNAQSAAKTAVDAALADLTVRLQAARTALDALGKATVIPGPLPPPLGAALSAVPQALQPAIDALTNQDASAATATLEDCKTELRTALGSPWASWLQEYQVQEAGLMALRVLMDPRLDADRGLVEGALLDPRQYHLAEPKLIRPDIEDLLAFRQAVQSWSAMGAARGTALRQWSGHISRDAVAFLTLVGGRAPDRAGLKPEVQADLDAKAEAVALASRAFLDSLAWHLAQAAPFDAVTVDPEPLIKAMSDLVRALIATIPATDASTQALDFLEQRQIFQAVRALPYVGAQDWQAPVGAAARAIVPSQPNAAPGPAAAVTPTTAPSIAPTPVDAQTLELLQANASRELRVAQRWTSAIVGLLTILVSYAFFCERFVGTTGDFLGLFFWGMSADLSAAGLTALQSNLATPPKKA